MTKNGAQILFYDTHCKIKSAQNEIVMSAEQISNGVYIIKLSGDAKMNIVLNPKKNVVLAATVISRASLQIWHRRLAHLNYKAVCNLPQHAEGIQITDAKQEFCQACAEGKHIRRPFFQSKSRAKAILDLIHTGLCVVNVPSHGNYKYVMTVCDDHSKMSFIYLLKLKSEAAKAIENFIIFAQNQKGRTVKAVRSDNGCEYENNHLFNLFAKMGIDHQVTVPHNSQSNGRAERLNST